MSNLLPQLGSLPKPKGALAILLKSAGVNVDALQQSIAGALSDGAAGLKDVVATINTIAEKQDQILTALANLDKKLTVLQSCGLQHQQSRPTGE